MQSCETAFKVDLIIKNCSNGEEFCLDNEICVDEVAVHANCNNTEIVHIAGLDEVFTIDLPKPRRQTVDITIGTYNEYLHDVSEIRRSTKCNIAAKLCRLGWALVGHLGSRESQVMLIKSIDGCELNCRDIHSNNLSMMQAESLDIHRPTHFISNGHADSCELLHAEINHYYNAEFATNVDDDDEAMPSINDMLCTKTFNESLTKLEGRYYIRLPIKDDVDKLPNNRQQAESRSLQQRKLMKNNAELLDFYTNAVQKLIDTDKLELVDADCDSTPNRTFYIPHFITKQAKKRLVYDGSARFNNVSLNSVSHKGSDN